VAVAGDVAAICSTLRETYPAAIIVLSGITLRHPDTGQRALLDLVAITEQAIMVGVDSGREPAELIPPRPAGQLVIRRQQAAGISPLLPVYVFWLGDAAPESVPDPSPALADESAIRRYIQQASRQNPPAGHITPAEVAEMLRRADTGPGPSGPPTPPVRRALRRFGALPGLVIPESLRAQAVLPADVRRRLQAAMLDRKNHLEDANYGKVVPNDYLVELNEASYARHYQPIADDVCRQWQKQLLDALNTANSRQGRRWYRFGGPVTVQLRPVAHLAENEVNIVCQVQAAPPVAPEMRPVTACLEAHADGRRTQLGAGTMVIGRSSKADLVLDEAQVVERRLISGRHAYLVGEAGQFRLFDGSPEGKPSLNGTYVNGQPVPAGGQLLNDGDLIVLAALDPAYPRPDAPGVAAFTFRSDCP
jgi:hypothetical protein